MEITVRRTYNTIQKTDLKIGDYVKYTYDPKSERISGKGIVTQITSACLFIHPDNAHHKCQTEAIAFSEIYIGEAKVERILPNQDIYCEV